MTDVPSDVELVTEAQDGNHEAWSKLCHRHARRLAAYLGARLRRPKVVDKLVEDSIVAAWKHLHQLDDPKEFGIWFRRIGANLALRWYREHQEESLTEPFPSDLCGTDAEKLKRMTRLEAALGRLNDPQRMALEQRFRGGMSGEVLHQSLHLDVGGSDRLLDEALSTLSRLLGNDTRS